MNTYVMFALIAASSLALSLLVIPIVKNLAIRIKLVDKPNARKVHTSPVPLAGGISIAVTVLLVLFFNTTFMQQLSENIVWLSAAFIILITGVLDDRYDIKPIYRLAIQIGCAVAVAASGIRLTSFYGVFGITDIPVWIQYSLTVMVIAGVVNAYNLMDGIDGLIGSLSLVACAVLGIISIEFGQMDLTFLFLALVGAVVGFLFHNLSNKKIFMGDAGSLFIGFIMVVAAIKLLDVSAAKTPAKAMKVLLLATGVFLVPVLDSLRVYRGRIKKGISPFKADKTHLHHLFLYLGLTHKRATFLIMTLSAIILTVASCLIYLIPVTAVILCSMAVFIIVTTSLSINRSVIEWKEKLKEMERS